jgi:PIN domain nuclease of toxin-antitoxin system
MKKEREQTLLDLLFEISLTIKNNKFFKKQSQEQTANWIREQLAANEIYCYPIGSSHGVLFDTKEELDEFLLKIM